MDASQYYREVPSVAQDLVQCSLTFDIVAFVTPQTVFERPMTAD